LVYQNRVQ